MQDLRSRLPVVQDVKRRIGRLVGLACALAAACAPERATGPAPATQALASGRAAGDLGAGTILLRGTVIVPEGVIKHGYVGIANGRIAWVSDKQPEERYAVTLNTHGIILPGLVDLHNHVPWNVLPRWSPGRQFTNRDQWAADAEYRATVAAPFNHLAAVHFCDMNAWGELRALVGGTTSILATQAVPCIHGLVRNLDWNSGFYGTTELDREHVFNVLRLPPAGDPAARAGFVGAARFFLSNPFYEALVMHVAEGTDAAAEEEVNFLEAQALLNPKGVLIHGISLVADDFRALAATGTAMVWSPRSNLELYGTTADISAALEAGVEIALAPDWAITGSSNLLDELKTAASWNRAHLGGRLSYRQLVDMVTSVPARVVGVEEEVGAVRPGLRADLLVIGGDHNDPWQAVVDAAPEDVELVLIGGVPIYGERWQMGQFWEATDLEALDVSGGSKALATRAAGVVASEIAHRLETALLAEGTRLAALVER